MLSAPARSRCTAGRRQQSLSGRSLTDSSPRTTPPRPRSPPVMDGFELTRRMKEEDRFKHIPVIALTSLASEEDQEKGREVGIDEYQIKLDKDRLLNSLASYLQAYA